MSNKHVYKRVLENVSKGDPEVALITGLNWIKQNLRKELKLVPNNYELIIQNKILVIQFPVLITYLEFDLELLYGKDDPASKILIDICGLKTTDLNALDKLCEIISTIRKNSEEQAILRDFKLL
jgi:hypothetical protein